MEPLTEAYWSKRRTVRTLQRESEITGKQNHEKLWEWSAGTLFFLPLARGSSDVILRRMSRLNATNEWSGNPKSNGGKWKNSTVDW
jgi:hypothetical protein